MGKFGIYGVMVAAILAEVVATTALARSQGFTRAGPSLVAVLGYVVSFYLMSHALRVLPTGVVYGLWSGLGLVLIAAVAWLGYGQRLEAPTLVGLALILSGVMVVHLGAGPTAR